MSSKAKKSADAKVSKTSGKKGKEAEDEIVEEFTESMEAAKAAEEDAEEEEELEAASSSSGGSAAALAAAAASPTEGPGSLKNFRHHPDMENFYRFIYENDLRLEALQILDEMMVQRELKKSGGKAKT